MSPDYSLIDQTPLVQFIFYPRSDRSPCPAGAFDLSVPVSDGATIVCRFYAPRIEDSCLLYFHGNGEVVSDYDDIAPYYNRIGLNLVVADYRGYGFSTGRPSLGTITRDCHDVYAAVRRELERRGHSDRLFLMGRSLGSMSVIEIAARNTEGLRGVIIESGFASVLTVMEHLGLPMPRGFDRDRTLAECLRMVARITTPCLIIHGEDDSLVPVGEASVLYEHLGSSEKELLIIHSADHNTIMFTDLARYMAAIRSFAAAH